MRRLLLFLLAALVLAAPAAAVNTHIEVYFKKGHRGAVAIVTWDRRDRTLDKIGPCSTVTAFKQAYPNAGKFKQNGKVIAYRLGRLIFTAETSRIGDVMLATPAVSPYVALNAPECGVS